MCTVGATAASNSAAVEEQRKIMPYDPENGVGEVIGHTACAYEGKLYVLGATAVESPSRFFRATAFDAAEDPFDAPISSASSDDSSDVPINGASADGEVLKESYLAKRVIRMLPWCWL